MSNPHVLAVETDTKIADIYGQLDKVLQQIGWHENTIRHAAGQHEVHTSRTRSYWSTSRKGYDVATLNDALAFVVVVLDDHADDSDYAMPFPGGMNLGQVRRATATRAQLLVQVEDLHIAIADLNLVWKNNGRWNRFFLVTSSAGHIHSSTSCSTCRQTTQFGWLPDVSGLTEVEAVAEHGPLLCSKCFPSAPVEWTLTVGEYKRAQKAAAAK